ncbi:MAG: MEDS domain-containing protein [Nitrososphaeraceae archaeon]
MPDLGEPRNRVNIPIERFLETLKAGEHGCIFFFSKEQLHKIQFSFVKSGLERNWGIVYLTATEPIESVRNSMQKFGINTQYYEAEGEDDNDNKSLIILRGEELYKNPEKPDIENWVNTAKSLCEMFVFKKGKKGVRVAADLSSYFLSRGLARQWHDLEYALEKRISLPMSVLCAYDSRIKELLDMDVLKFYTKLHEKNKEFVDAHSFAIYTSRANNVTFTV